jgi:hypothetical protein
VLQSAAGARENPLWLYTTTEGYETPGPWPELRQFAQQLLEGVFQADHFLASSSRSTTKDDDFDETKWIKANPLMDVNPLLEREIRKEAIEAKRCPASTPSSGSSGSTGRARRAAWINVRSGGVREAGRSSTALRGRSASGGLDLASRPT